MSKKQMAVPVSTKMVLVSTERVALPTKMAAPVSTKMAAPSSTVVATPSSTAQPPRPADASQLSLLPLPGVHS